MARINNGIQRDWVNGDVMTSDDYEQDRGILTTAINDNQDQLDALHASTGSGLVGSQPITGVDGATVYAQLQSLKNLIGQAMSGTIPDGTLGIEKLNFTPLLPSNKGGANGLSVLDANGLVPASQLPLYDGTDSTDSTKIATAHALNLVYVLATTLATTLKPGIVQLTNSVASTSTDTAATPAAVKAAYDLANQANSKSFNPLTIPLAWIG